MEGMLDATPIVGVFVIFAIASLIMALQIIGSALTLGMVGYGAGLTGRRSPLTAIVMIVVLGAVITLVVDLDTPQGGFIEVSQRPRWISRARSGLRPANAMMRSSRVAARVISAVVR